MTLYEAIKTCGSGLDICDTVYDFTSHIDFSTNLDGEPRDDYSHAMIDIARRIELVQLRMTGYSECKINDFLEEYEYAFKQLMEEYLESMPTSDDFYDRYFITFEQLTLGGWPMEAYGRLVELLNHKPEAEQVVSSKEVTVDEITQMFGLTQTALAVRIGGPRIINYQD